MSARPPGDVIGGIRFADGSSVELRPMTVTDGRNLARFALSPLTTTRPDWIPDSHGALSHWVAGLINADQEEHLTLGAVVTDRFGAVVVAVSELDLRGAEPGTAKVSIAQLADWPDANLGTFLIRRLANRSRRLGVRRWEAHHPGPGVECIELATSQLSLQRAGSHLGFARSTRSAPCVSIDFV